MPTFNYGERKSPSHREALYFGFYESKKSRRTATNRLGVRGCCGIVSLFLKREEMSLNAKYINDVSRNRKDKIHFLCLCHFCLPGWCCAGGLVLLPAGLLP